MKEINWQLVSWYSQFVFIIYNQHIISFSFSEMTFLFMSQLCVLFDNESQLPNSNSGNFLGNSHLRLHYIFSCWISCHLEIHQIMEAKLGNCCKIELTLYCAAQIWCNVQIAAVILWKPCIAITIKQIQ